jgi:WD40 repeat protein
MKLIYKAHDNMVRCVCVSADSKYFISGSRDKSIKIWNIEGNLIKSIDKAHDEYIVSVCISADSKYIISGS